MPTISYDDRSFLLDGERIWLVSGEIAYFRVPRALWRDRLLKAKRAGLNCISTQIAWNFHEPAEGQWEWEEDRDVGTFIRMADDLGLYVIVRPGPFIGGEWDFGGLPGWLAAKSGVSYRTSNAAFTHFCDKYLAHGLSRLADLQVTRGGNIVLIQSENDYFRTTMPDRQNYLDFVSQLFRRSGFDIPIVTRNGLTDPVVASAVESVGGFGSEVEQLKKLRLHQPGAPMLVSEFGSGGADIWGAEHRSRNGREIARRAMEILGCGAQCNYYPWHGGTNFGFWGARRTCSDAAYQVTSHDADAPLAEGGGLTETYYLTRLVNLTANHMGRFLGEAVMDSPGVTIRDSTEVLNLLGPGAHWAVVTHHGRDEIHQVTISLPEGRELSVPLDAIGAAAIPAEVHLSAETKLDYANLTPLGFFWNKALAFHGPKGWPARISVNGRVLRETVPDSDEPKILDHEGLKIVLVNSDLGMRTWVLDEHLVFGPDFVGETIEEDVIPRRGGKQFCLLSREGVLSRKKYRDASAAKPSIRLGAWKRSSVCREPVAEDLEWRPIDRPRDVDRLGLHQGYVWYRAEVDCPRPRKCHLFLPDCEDRATIFVNGDRVGVWGRGDGASREPMAAGLKKGRNVLTFLADNLGRFCDEFEPFLGGPKGLFGSVYEAKGLRIGKLKIKAFDQFTRRMVPRPLSHLIPTLETQPVQAADVSVSLSSVMPIHLSFSNVPHHLCVMCNGRVAKFFPNSRTGENFGDLTLGAELKKGANALKFLIWGDLDPKTLDNVKFHLLTQDLCEGASWSVRPWTCPEPGGPVVGKERPAWYTAKFKADPEVALPLFLRVAGARKGQILLNGHNVGRFWSVGPQKHYYLPSCWLEEENELRLFDECGLTPSGSRLEFRPRGPFRD